MSIAQIFAYTCIACRWTRESSIDNKKTTTQKKNMILCCSIFQHYNSVWFVWATLGDVRSCSCCAWWLSHGTLVIFVRLQIFVHIIWFEFAPHVHVCVCVCRRTTVDCTWFDDVNSGLSNSITIVSVSVCTVHTFGGLYYAGGFICWARKIATVTRS